LGHCIFFWRPIWRPRRKTPKNQKLKSPLSQMEELASNVKHVQDAIIPPPIKPQKILQIPNGALKVKGNNPAPNSTEQ
jgi:hypothetical protein